MNTFACIIILINGLTLALCNSTFNPELICTLVKNNTKINDPRACNKWIQCIDGEPVSGTCDSDLYYDRETEDCVDSDSIKCISSEPCATNPNGFAADPYSCNGYYYCLNGVGTRGECSGGLNYNPGTQDCIRNFPCQEKMNPDSYCNILADGVFIKDPASCNGWQMCWKGVVINGTCPGTFYFSAVESECDYPYNVDCAITEKPFIAENGECAKPGDFISDNSTCNGYYYCRELSDGQIELEHGECADGRFFDAANNGACVPRANIRCPYDRCVDLGTGSIQLAYKSDDDCSGYAICQDGTTIGYGTCPSDMFFDEQSQRCSSQVITYPACMSSMETSTTQID